MNWPVLLSFMNLTEFTEFTKWVLPIWNSKSFAADETLVVSFWSLGSDSICIIETTKRYWDLDFLIWKTFELIYFLLSHQLDVGKALDHFSELQVLILPFHCFPINCCLQIRIWSKYSLTKIRILKLALNLMISLTCLLFKQMCFKGLLLFRNNSLDCNSIVDFRAFNRAT